MRGNERRNMDGAEIEAEAREAAHKLLELMQDRVTSLHQASKEDPQWCQVRHVFILYRDLALKASNYFEKRAPE